MKSLSQQSCELVMHISNKFIEIITKLVIDTEH